MFAPKFGRGIIYTQIKGFTVVICGVAACDCRRICLSRKIKLFTYNIEEKIADWADMVYNIKRNCWRSAVDIFFDANPTHTVPCVSDWLLFSRCGWSGIILGNG